MAGPWTHGMVLLRASSRLHMNAMVPNG